MYAIGRYYNEVDYRNARGTNLPIVYLERLAVKYNRSFLTPGSPSIRTRNRRIEVTREGESTPCVTFYIDKFAECAWLLHPASA